MTQVSDTDSNINYDAKVQDALRGVVRSVLEDTERDGLAGDHHFYVAFKTRAPGVVLPDHLKARFPDEMTIVLQHKFWGLKVSEDQFEVGLSFDRKPEILVIPFAAIVGFVDPSVQFALQFNDDADGDSGGLMDLDGDLDGDITGDLGADMGDDDLGDPSGESAHITALTSAHDSDTGLADPRTKTAKRKKDGSKVTDSDAASQSAKHSGGKADSATSTGDEDSESAPGVSDGSNVVTLDTFRKK